MQPRKRSKIATPRPPRVSSDVTFSYKDSATLGKFVSEQGYIVGRSKTGLSQKQQRQLAQEIKRARHLALLPYTQTV